MSHATQVYRDRQTSVRVTLDLAERCDRWTGKLPYQLRWRNDFTPLASFHGYLTHFYSLVLLTRPLFLRHTQCQILGTSSTTDDVQKIADGCVIASKDSINLVDTAYQKSNLPRLNAMSTYCTFQAGLVICTRRYCNPLLATQEESWIEKCIQLLHYCGQADAYAEKAAVILTNFRDIDRFEMKTIFDATNDQEMSQIFPSVD